MRVVSVNLGDWLVDNAFEVLWVQNVGSGFVACLTRDVARLRLVVIGWYDASERVLHSELAVEGSGHVPIWTEVAPVACMLH